VNNIINIDDHYATLKVMEGDGEGLKFTEMAEGHRNERQYLNFPMAFHG
jgi:hypothetical protein